METPLQRLCRNINTPEDATHIKVLLDNGANYLLADMNGITPAMYICNSNDETLFDHFLNIIPDINMALNPDKDTALHITVRSGVRCRVLKVLKRRPNVNRQNKEGDTPVHLAVSVTRHRLLEDLVEHGGDINAHCNFKLTPLHLVGKTGCTDVLFSVLKCNPNLNQPDLNGHTPLMFLLKFHYGQIHLITALIDHGADPTITDTFGYNCLHYISSSNRYSSDVLDELTRLFIECGTDIDCQFSNSHMSALHIAINLGYRMMTYILLRHGASLEQTNFLDDTPLDNAICSRDTRVTSEVLSFIALRGEPLEKFLCKKYDDLEPLISLYDKYLKELDILKQLHVGEHGLTQYDVLTAPIRKIVIYLNQGVNLEYFDCLNLSDYPCLYRLHMSHKIKDAKKYRVAVRTVDCFLEDVFSLHPVPLPSEVVHQITHTLGFYEVLRLHRVLSVQADQQMKKDLSIFASGC